MSEQPTLPEFINNHHLFQDYYLDAYLHPTIPLSPEEITHGASLEEARNAANDALSQVNALWNKRAKQLTTSESNVEHFVADVCRILGLSVASQGSIRRTGETTQRTDLVLFANDADNDEFAQSLQARLPADKAYAHALALVEVKPVDTDFESSKGTSRTKPFQQIIGYLTHTGVPWGILTDGFRWRIYRRFDPPRYNEYFEINLKAMLEKPDQPSEQQEAFWWFYAFFHRDALNRHQRHARVDTLYAGSERYATGVQKSLRDQAFHVVEELARGISVANPNPNPDHAYLATLYEQAIILLFRLLFLKFAEDKELLPVRNPNYQRYGYTGVEKDLLHSFDDPDIRLSESVVNCIAWMRLQTLFHHLNTGNPDAGIFAYNGGLFRPDRVDGIMIPDAFLARAIDHLVRIVRDGKKVRISYRDLATRHLGSIYESLLEQHLEFASDSDHSTIHLVSTSGERSNQRRTSGSYYTPDYIVDYIVQQTIDPLCKGKRADEIAQIRILDPSMGSGHFLVAALNRLAEHHATAKQRERIPYPERDPAESDDAFAVRVEEYDMSIAPTEEDRAESERTLVEHCIYGVDLNPLAVELAKLALWLSTLSSDRSLSFLDHHLRVGNSLVGARLEHVSSLAGLSSNGKNNGNGKKKNGNGKSKNGNGQGTIYQMGLFEQIVWRVRDHILTYFQRIAALPSTTPDQIHQKEHAYAEFREYSKPFRQVANLWVSSHFGTTLNDQDSLNALEALDDVYAESPDRSKWHALETQPWFLHAQEVADHHRFFHWELEFPQVFLQEQKGFDAAVGNPPYVDIKGLDKALTDYLFNVYSTMRLRINLFAAILERSMWITDRTRSLTGFIIPTSFLTQVSYSSLRSIILDNYWLKTIVRLPNELFGNSVGQVKVDTCIIVTAPMPDCPKSEIKTTILFYKGFARTDSISADNAEGVMEIPQQDWMSQKEKAIVLSSSRDTLVMNKIQKISVSLETLCDFCLGITPYDKYAGHTPEQISKKVFHATSKINNSYKKLLVSGDVRRYEVIWNGTQWISYGEWLASPREERFFTNPRILVQQIIDWSSQRLFASWTDEELCNTQNQFNLLAKGSTNLKFIVSIMNSTFMSYYHRKFFLDVALQRFQKVLIKDAKAFPIRRISFTTPETERSLQCQEAITLYESENNSQILTKVEQCLSAQPEKSDIVHDILAYLSQQMIEMNRHRRQQITKLLTDLEGALDTSDWEKLGKTRQLWNHKAKKVQGNSKMVSKLGHLAEKTLTIDEDIGKISRDQWKWLLKYKLGNVKKMSNLLNIYDEYHADIATTEERLAKTDALIDQIVYLLYGLTLDEVAVVESSMRRER